ncbi:hypothetical protein ABIC90_004898 [Variovorax boronicumulans]
MSQYLIGDVIYSGDFDARNTVLRILLFKLFNKIETWELLEEKAGVLDAASFNVSKLNSILTDAMQAGERIYSAAYIMPSALRIGESTYKHKTHLDLLAAVLRDGIMERILTAKSFQELFFVLRGLPGIGPFLAYQYAIDLTYSEYFNFSEDDFVQPGPGALHGLMKCFSSLGDYTPAETIEWVKDRQDAEFERLGLKFPSLWGRPLHLIDCQNLFCETDKYARVAHPEFSEMTGRTRIKQRFSPKGELKAPRFPPKWKIDVKSSQQNAETNIISGDQVESFRGQQELRF